MNMREQPELMTQEQYASICEEMLAFQEANNRLSFADDADTPRFLEEEDTVEDKSLSLLTDEEAASVADNVAASQGSKGKGLFKTIRSAFRSP